MRHLFISTSHTFVRLFIVVLLCLLTTSCWSSHNIEDQTYLTAIGIDYKDGEYYLYGQELNFKEIDNPSIREGNQSKGIIIGTGTGKSLYEAAYSLTKTTQGRIEWGHFQTIIVTEAAMNKDSLGLIRKLYRSPDTRDNCWLFVTKEPIEDILNVSNLYDDASLRIIIYNPVLSYEQRTHIKPMPAFKALATYMEPDRTLILPIITIDNKQWQANRENLDLLKIGGAYITSLYGNHVTLDEDEADLLRSTFKPSRFSISVKNGEETAAVVNLNHRHKSIKPTIVGSNVSFNMSLTLIGAMLEYNEPLTYDELIAGVKKNVEDEIRAAFTVGLENEIDILNLMPSLRQKNPVLWRELTNDGQTFILTEDSLESITISVKVPFSGKYKWTVDPIN